VLPSLLQCLVDTCKFTSWNYKESVILSLLYQMFLLSITEENRVYCTTIITGMLVKKFCIWKGKENLMYQSEFRFLIPFTTVPSKSLKYVVSFKRLWGKNDKNH
jgi:hypothetical protein